MTPIGFSNQTNTLNLTSPPSGAFENSNVEASSTPVSKVDQTGPSLSTNELPNVVIDRVIALYDFVPQTPEAIGFPKDAIISILDKTGDWWLGEYNGKIGILPYNYVQSLSPANGKFREIRDFFLLS